MDRLVDAVLGSTGQVDGALADAIESGALVYRGEHVLVPHGADGSLALPERWEPWSRRGFLPFHVKQNVLPVDRMQGLAVLMATVNELPALRAVPTWMVGETSFSLHLRDATDLRQVLGDAPADHAERVHAACLRSLTLFTAHDEELRDATRGIWPRGVPLFPVRERYRAARVRLRRLLGPIDIPDVLPRYAEHGPITLFCDPKPANFLVPEAGDPLDSDEWPMRVDLDLMYYECPLSLQIVLALFAHPVVFHREGTIEEQFDDLLGYAHTAGIRCGVASDEIDAMVLYHLLRNFASVSVRDDRADAVKARALAPVLRCAVERLTAGTETARRLDSWLMANGP